MMMINFSDTDCALESRVSPNHTMYWEGANVVFQKELAFVTDIGFL